MSPIPAEAHEEIGDHVDAVLAFGAAGDLDGAMRAIDEIISGYGPWGAYGVAQCLVEEMVAGLPAPAGADERFWTLDFPGIDDASYDLRWAARFISAYVNADDTTGKALYAAAIADGQVRECIGTLVGSTVATTRRS